MTAIAYDGKTISVDRAATSGEVRTAVQKLRFLSGDSGTFVSALCGSSAWITQVEKYFNRFDPHGMETEFPNVEPYTENGRNLCFGLLYNLDSKRMYSLSGDGTLIPEEGNLLTAGACYSFLHGVLCTGAGSKTAVALSQIYSDGSGLGVCTLDLEAFWEARAEWSQSKLEEMCVYMDPLEVAAHVSALRSFE